MTVFEYLKDHYTERDETPSMDTLIQAFPKLGWADIADGIADYYSWREGGAGE